MPRVLPALTVRRLAAFALPLLALLAPPASAQGLTIDIVTPVEGATVAGAVAVTGTSSGLTSGFVTVSVDGGPFQLAQGKADWTFEWDASDAGDGPHSITARARECIFCPTVTDTVNVFVDSTATTVAIATPSEGAQVFGNVVVAGSASNADLVELTIDGSAFEGGPFGLAGGDGDWSFTVDGSGLAEGPHLFEVLATGPAGAAADSVAIEVGPPLPGQQPFTYLSSVDGQSLTGVLQVPPSYDPAGPAVPLLVYLHGAGGQGSITGALATELDARGWIGVAPDGRPWDLAGCNWPFSPAYVDNPFDPEVGPGEQDILDAIDWAESNFAVDPARIYLTGFSYGGRGAYIIGLKNPDRFAAIAPMGPASDMYEVFARKPENCFCKEGITGGIPGDSAVVDTLYTTTSARFLIENAYNLPVYHAHGTNDSVTSNNLAFAPYLHGWHMTNDGSFSADHTTAPDYATDCLTDPSILPISVGFGHTPTLAELAARHPGAYDWAYMFTPVGHFTDPDWFTGTVPGFGDFGVADPSAPGALLGAMDFLAARSTVDSPESILFKTYTDAHRQSFWIELDISTPWLDLPGAVLAERDGNALSLEVVRAAEVSVDLERADLTVGSSPLTITLAPLSDPAYDPNLSAPGEPNAPVITLVGDLSGTGAVEVSLDGAPLDPALIALGVDALSIGPIDVGAPRALSVVASPWTDLGFALAGIAGEPRLAGSGALTPAAPTALELTDAAPSSPGALVVSLGSVPVPFAGGTLAASPSVGAPIAFATDLEGGFTLTFDWPAGITSGTAIAVQAAILDPVATASIALSNALLAVVP